MPLQPVTGIVSQMDDRSAQSGTRIAAIETRIVDCPTTRRHKLSSTEVTAQSYVIVELHLANGIRGWGEAATLGGPRWAEESVEAIKANIDTYIAPALLGQSALDFEDNALRMAKAIKRNTSARAAVEAAAIDAVGHFFELPATTLLGGRVREKLPLIWALASGDTDQEIEEARSKFARREHRDFKIKLGFQSPAEDMVRLRRIVEALDPGCRIIADVNQGWTEATAIRYLPALQELGVALIEQPLPANALAASARIASRSAIPIMVDEAAFSDREIVQNASLATGSVYSLKLVKSGGLFAMKRAAAVASAFGMELYGGCLLESGIGAAAHLAVFSSLPELQWGCEHFGPRILKRDLAKSGIEFDDFAIRVPNGNGLGITVDLDVLKDVTRKG